MKLIDTIKTEAEKLWATIVELFATHPDVDTFHKTSDDQFFEQKHHADAHAGGLPNKGVATITREEVKAKAVELKAAAPASGADDGIDIDDAEQLTAEQLATKALADENANKNLVDTLNGVVANAANAADTTGTGTIETTEVVTPKTPLQIAQETPEAERTPIQKGLITKAAKAAAATQSN